MLVNSVRTRYDHIHCVAVNKANTLCLLTRIYRFHCYSSGLDADDGLLSDSYTNVHCSLFNRESGLDILILGRGGVLEYTVPIHLVILLPVSLPVRYLGHSWLKSIAFIETSARA